MNKEQINQKKYSLMSCQTKSILLGSILGDGSLKIHKGYKNASFNLFILKIQRLFFWKREQVKKDLSSPKIFKVEELDPQSKKSFKLRYQSRVLIALLTTWSNPQKKQGWFGAYLKELVEYVRRASFGYLMVWWWIFSFNSTTRCILYWWVFIWGSSYLIQIFEKSLKYWSKNH